MLEYVKSESKIHVITIKWGAKYNKDDVNRLYYHIQKNTSYEIVLHCFTENPVGLNPNIISHDLPSMEIKSEHKQYSYIKEAGLCDDNLGGLNGTRVFFFDLDVLICANLDELFDFPTDKEFLIINDWNTKGDHVGQASLYSWVVGELGYIKDYYEKNSHQIVDQFYTASQEYLSYMVIGKFGKLNFWPQKWCVSYKQHCMPAWYLRYFKTPALPKGAKIIAFHGDPKPENAYLGIWSDYSMPWYKKIYKKAKPAPWILSMLSYQKS